MAFSPPFLPRLVVTPVCAAAGHAASRVHIVRMVPKAQDRGRLSLAAAAAIFLVSQVALQVANKEALLTGLPPAAVLLSQVVVGAVVGVASLLIADGEGLRRRASNASARDNPGAAAIACGSYAAAEHFGTLLSMTLVPAALTHTIRGAQAALAPFASVYGSGAQDRRTKGALAAGAIAAGIVTLSMLDSASTAAAEALFLLGICAAVGANAALHQRSALDEELRQDDAGAPYAHSELCHAAIFVVAPAALLTETPVAAYFTSANVAAAISHAAMAESASFLLPRLSAVSRRRLTAAGNISVILTMAATFRYSLSAPKVCALALALGGIAAHASGAPGAGGDPAAASRTRAAAAEAPSRRAAVALCAAVSFLLSICAAVPPAASNANPMTAPLARLAQPVEFWYQREDKSMSSRVMDVYTPFHDYFVHFGRGHIAEEDFPELPLFHTWLNYLEMYHNHMSRFRGRDVIFMEIGVQSGGKIPLLRHYFGEGFVYVGVDVNPSTKRYESADWVHIEVGDSSDPAFLAELRAKYPHVDIFLDDGGHRMDQQMIALREMLPHVQPQGVYILEDLSTSWTPGFGGLPQGRASNPAFLDSTTVGLVHKTFDWLQAPFVDPSVASAMDPDRVEDIRQDLFDEAWWKVVPGQVRHIHYYSQAVVYEKGITYQPDHLRTVGDEIPYQPSGEHPPVDWHLILKRIQELMPAADS